LRWVRELLSAAGVAAIVVLIGAAIATLDPMGLDDAADRHSADVVARMTAPYYGGEQPKGRDRVTVVEISDAALREMGETWPPPRDFYTQLLDTLAPADGPRPAAIFLDYILLSNLRDPEGQDRFIAKVHEITRAADWEDDRACRVSPAAKIGCIVEAGGVPVILGKPYPPDVCLAGMGDDIAELARFDAEAVVSPLGWPGAPETATPVFRRSDYAAALGVDPTRRQTTEDVAAWKSCRALQPFLQGRDHHRALPFETPTGKPVTWWGVPEYDLAPAGAMFAALCLGDRPPATCGDFLNEKGRLDWKGPDDMVVAWGSRADPDLLDLRKDLYADAGAHDAPCLAETRTLGRAALIGWRQLYSAIGGGVAAEAVPCPYHPTFDYALIHSEVAGGSELGATIRDDYLRGRVVAVGAAMVAGNDWIDTVVHGRLAGVHYHAMMLDNLIERGAGVLRSPEPVFPSGPLARLNIDWGEMLEFGAAFLVVVVVEIGRRRMAARERPDGRALLWIAGVFAWAIIVLAATTWLTVQLHWKPVNIVGLFGLTVLDATASFWSVEGLTWLVGVGWVGARNRSRMATRGLTNVVLRVAGGVGMLLSAFGKSVKPRGRPGRPSPSREESPPDVQI
jgi:CHASE2 domain-containing sensor protein